MRSMGRTLSTETTELNSFAIGMDEDNTRGQLRTNRVADIGQEIVDPFERVQERSSNERFGWKNWSEMITVRRLLIGGLDGKRDIRESPGGEWGAVGRRGIVTRTRIPAGRRNGTGNRQALSQWGPVNTTNRFSMLSNPPRLYRSKSYCRCFHSDHLGQGLLPPSIHPSVHSNRREIVFSPKGTNIIN